jgi:DNA (cytosine-5)-methyltransferase 1
MNFIDLFAGAGGLSEGFIRAGFEPVAHVEMDAAACNTLRTRASFRYLKEIGKLDYYHEYLANRISRKELHEFLPEEIVNSVINAPIGPENNRQIHRTIGVLRDNQDVDLIIGGPPCQAYSLVGRARSKDGMKGDPRNLLYVQYANYLEKYEPKMFVFENVMGLLSANSGYYLESMQALFEKKGYDLKIFKVDASDFGVLQKRQRVIIVGRKFGLGIPVPDLESKKVKQEAIVKDVFVDLPKIRSGTSGGSNYVDAPTDYLKKASIRAKGDILTQHIARPNTDIDKMIYKIAVKKWNKTSERLNYNDLPEELKTHNNRHSFFDRFKVVAQDLPYSQTVVAHIAKDGHYYIHPDITQNRSLTVREAARLQSFPDNFYFEGVKEESFRTAAFKQIGNAVPPLLAQRIAESIKAVLT